MEILPFALELIGIAVVVFLLILGAIYVSHRLLFVIERHREIARHQRRKLEAKQALEYDFFYDNLRNPRKELPPVIAEVVLPPVVDRFLNDDDEDYL